MEIFPFAVSAWIFISGLYGMATSRNLVHLIVCLSVLQSSTYILLGAVGFRKNASAPIFHDVPFGTPAVDPVIHALILTDIVVGAVVTALLLAIAVRIHRKRGSVDPHKLSPMKD